MRRRSVDLSHRSLSAVELDFTGTSWYFCVGVNSSARQNRADGPPRSTTVSGVSVLAALAMIGFIGIATVVGICVRACVDDHWAAVVARTRRWWRPRGGAGQSAGPFDAR